jgi:uncharacterized membrane protein (UPF0127 family)
MARKQKGRNNAKSAWAVLAIMTATVVTVLVFLLFQQAKTQPITAVRLGGYSYDVLSATNSAQWDQGLMNYTFACASPGNCVNGMLFVFPSDKQWCFWMKNTPEPLVQLWFSNGIVTNRYNATPESTTNVCGTGNEVLELYSKLPINATIGSRLAQGAG